MRELLDGIYSWSRLSEPHGYDFNGHFIPRPDENLVIDPVEPAPEDLEILMSEGVGRILITNRNHTRAANAVRKATGARIAIHPLDADHAKAEGCAVEDSLTHGELVGPLVVVPADGKSPGEVAFHWPERQVLIVGDAVIGNPPGRCGLLPEEKLDDPVGLRASLRMLLELDFDHLLVGDGTPILAGAKARLAELVASAPD